MKERREDWINSLYMYGKKVRQVYIWLRNMMEISPCHIFILPLIPLQADEYSVTWSQAAGWISSLPPSPHLSRSLSLHIPSNHWHHEGNRLLEPQRRWNGAGIECGREPKLRSVRRLRVHRGPSAAANWLDREWIDPPVISAVAPLHPPSLQCSHSPIVHIGWEYYSKWEADAWKRMLCLGIQRGS